MLEEASCSSSEEGSEEEEIGEGEEGQRKEGKSEGKENGDGICQTAVCD